VFDYADDVVLLATSTWAIRTMLMEGDKFAGELNLIFMAKKAKFLTFNTQKVLLHIHLLGTPCHHFFFNQR